MWVKPDEQLPLEVGDRVFVVVNERAYEGGPIVPRIIVLIAQEYGFTAEDETYSGYSIFDGSLWTTEQRLLATTRLNEKARTA